MAVMVTGVSRYGDDDTIDVVAGGHDVTIMMVFLSAEELTSAPTLVVKGPISLTFSPIS